MKQEYDEIGIWSEVKLDIVREYVAAYSTILSKQRLRHMYVDAFAGSGVSCAYTKMLVSMKYLSLMEFVSGLGRRPA